MGRQPIDEGWSWMICLGTGVQAFFVIGGLKTLGVLFVEILETFGTSATVASLTMGLGAGGFAVFALLNNGLFVMVGPRVLVMFGAVFFTFSIFMASFTISVWYSIIFLGLTSGIAMGAMLTPSVILLTMYFDKRKSFANGLALAGSSIGQLVLPYVMTYVIEIYGFSGGMWIYTGIAMHSIPAAMLLRPLSFWNRRHKWHHRHAVNKSVSYNVDGNAASDSPSPHKALMPHSSNPRLNESQPSALEYGSVSMIPGISVESINLVGQQAKQEQLDPEPIPGRKIGIVRVKSISCRDFCHAVFDRELLCSPCLWLLFFGLGLGHAGFIDVVLHLPVLSVELFDSKRTGAMLLTIVGVFDLCGRVVGGWFSDQGYMTRSAIIIMGFLVSGISTILVSFHPILPLLIVYGVLLGVFGGLYRILLPIIVGDMFGRQKVGPGVSMLFMSLGLIIVPVPSALGYMQEKLHSYIPPYQVCGAMILFGAVLMGVIEGVKKYDKAVVKPEKNQLPEPEIVDVVVDENDKKKSQTSLDRDKEQLETSLDT